MKDKQTLINEINRYKKNKKIFLIIAIVLSALALLSFIAGTLVYIYLPEYEKLFALLIYLSDFFLSGSLVMFLLRVVLFNFRIQVRERLIAMMDNNNSYDTPFRDYPNQDVVNAEAHVLSKEESLIREYEKLYEQGLISKDDLERRKKEILNK
ncbi:MAG: hypothetical protein SO206_01840 [Bacilli bacterium]|nr:hypothetical protein [Bacilli bacterium]